MLSYIYYTYTFPKKKQIFSCVILTHTAAGLSSKLVAVQCTVAIDIDLTRNRREETSVLNSSRFNMFELQMCGFVCLDVSMNPVVYATSKVWTGSIFEAYWTNSHLRQKHVEVVSSCNKNWKGVIKQCISCGVMMNPTKKLERSQGHFPRWLLRWIPGNATCPRAHAHWYYQTWTATASSSQDFVQNPSTMFS